jgi:integrase
MSRKSIELPDGVHRVTARSREYFYYQSGRGTPRQGPRIRLPCDPHSPEFWAALRQAQGIVGPVATDTVNALIDAYVIAWPTLPDKLSEGSQEQYRRQLKLARDAWGELKVDGLRPAHIQAMMDGLAATPAKANNFLSCMRALSSWARARDHITQSLVEGVKPFDRSGAGHKPWTPEQIAAAHTLPAGTVRRGVMLYLYTGQRGSDVVRLGWTDIDEGGFSITQVKTGRSVWCPIVPELATEMATWEKRPGPFLLQESGKRYSRAMFWNHFDVVRAQVPAIAGVTLHGLRCTAVIRLRREGLSSGQIGDITGMSLATIEKYCRFADRKTSGQAALLKLTGRKRTNEQQEL